MLKWALRGPADQPPQPELPSSRHLKANLKDSNQCWLETQVKVAHVRATPKIGAKENAHNGYRENGKTEHCRDSESIFKKLKYFSSSQACAVNKKRKRQHKHIKCNALDPLRLFSGDITDSDTGSVYMRLEHTPVALKMKDQCTSTTGLHDPRRRPLIDISNGDYSDLRKHLQQISSSSIIPAVGHHHHSSSQYPEDLLRFIFPHHHHSSHSCLPKISKQSMEPSKMARPDPLGASASQINLLECLQGSSGSGKSRFNPSICGYSESSNTSYFKGATNLDLCHLRQVSVPEESTRTTQNSEIMRSNKRHSIADIPTISMSRQTYLNKKRDWSQERASEAKKKEESAIYSKCKSSKERKSRCMKKHQPIYEKIKIKKDASVGCPLTSNSVSSRSSYDNAVYMSMKDLRARLLEGAKETSAFSEEDTDLEETEEHIYSSPAVWHPALIRSCNKADKNIYENISYLPMNDTVQDSPSKSINNRPLPEPPSFESEVVHNTCDFTSEPQKNVHKPVAIKVSNELIARFGKSPNDRQHSMPQYGLFISSEPSKIPCKADSLLSHNAKDLENTDGKVKLYRSNGQHIHIDYTERNARPVHLLYNLRPPPPPPPKSTQSGKAKSKTKSRPKVKVTEQLPVIYENTNLEDINVLFKKHRLRHSMEIEFSFDDEEDRRDSMTANKLSEGTGGSGSSPDGHNTSGSDNPDSGVSEGITSPLISPLSAPRSPQSPRSDSLFEENYFKEVSHELSVENEEKTVIENGFLEANFEKLTDFNDFENSTASNELISRLRCKGLLNDTIIMPTDVSPFIKNSPIIKKETNLKNEEEYNVVDNNVVFERSIFYDHEQVFSTPKFALFRRHSFTSVDDSYCSLPKKEIFGHSLMSLLDVKLRRSRSFSCLNSEEGSGGSLEAGHASFPSSMDKILQDRELRFQDESNHKMDLKREERNAQWQVPLTTKGSGSEGGGGTGVDPPTGPNLVGSHVITHSPRAHHHNAAYPGNATPEDPEMSSAQMFLGRPVSAVPMRGGQQKSPAVLNEYITCDWIPCRGQKLTSKQQQRQEESSFRILRLLQDCPKEKAVNRDSDDGASGDWSLEAVLDESLDRELNDSDTDDVSICTAFSDVADEVIASKICDKLKKVSEEKMLAKLRKSFRKKEKAAPKVGILMFVDNPMYLSPEVKKEAKIVSTARDGSTWYVGNPMYNSPDPTGLKINEIRQKLRCERENQKNSQLMQVAQNVVPATPRGWLQTNPCYNSPDTKKEQDHHYLTPMPAKRTEGVPPHVLNDKNILDLQKFLDHEYCTIPGDDTESWVTQSSSSKASSSSVARRSLRFEKSLKKIKKEAALTPSRIWRQDSKNQHSTPRKYQGTLEKNIDATAPLGAKGLRTPRSVKRERRNKDKQSPRSPPPETPPSSPQDATAFHLQALEEEEDPSRFQLPPDGIYESVPDYVNVPQKPKNGPGSLAPGRGTPRKKVSRKYRARDVLQGKGQLKVAAYENFGLLTIHIIEARRLKSRYCNSCNPYVKISLVPDSNERTFCRTPVVKNDRYPVFDQKFSFDFLPDDLDKRLLLSVWNRDTVRRRSEFLGCMSFSVSHILKKRVDGWFRLLTEPVGRRKHFAVSFMSSFCASEQQYSKLDSGPALPLEAPSIPKMLRPCPPPSVSTLLVPHQGGQTPYTLTVKFSRGEQGFGFSVAWTQPPRVERVEDGLPAAQGGLRPGDYIIFVGQQNVVKMAEDDVLDIIRSCGDNLVLEVYRRGGMRAFQPQEGHSRGDITPPRCSQRRKKLSHVTFSNEDLSFKSEEILGNLMTSETHFCRLCTKGFEAYVIPLQFREDLITAEQHATLFESTNKIFGCCQRLLELMMQGKDRIGKAYYKMVDYLAEAYSTYMATLSEANKVLSEKLIDKRFLEFIETPALVCPDITTFLHLPLEHLQATLSGLLQVYASSSDNDPDLLLIEMVLERLTTVYQNAIARYNIMEPLPVSPAASPNCNKNFSIDFPSRLSLRPPLVTVTDIDKRLIFTKNAQPFRLDDGQRKWIFGGELWRVENRSSKPYWAMLFTDILLFTTINRNRVIFVMENPVLLSRVVKTVCAVKKRETEFQLVIDSSTKSSKLQPPTCASRSLTLQHESYRKGKKETVYLKAPTVELKATWSLLIQKQINEVRCSSSYQSASSNGGTPCSPILANSSLIRAFSSGGLQSLSHSVEHVKVGSLTELRNNNLHSNVKKCYSWNATENKLLSHPIILDKRVKEDGAAALNKPGQISITKVTEKRVQCLALSKEICNSSLKKKNLSERVKDKLFTKKKGKKIQEKRQKFVKFMSQEHQSWVSDAENKNSVSLNLSSDEVFLPTSDEDADKDSTVYNKMNFTSQQEGITPNHKRGSSVNLIFRKHEVQNASLKSGTLLTPEDYEDYIDSSVENDYPELAVAPQPNPTGTLSGSESMFFMDENCSQTENRNTCSTCIEDRQHNSGFTKYSNTRVLWPKNRSCSSDKESSGNSAASTCGSNSRTSSLSTSESSRMSLSSNSILSDRSSGVDGKRTRSILFLPTTTASLPEISLEPPTPQAPKPKEDFGFDGKIKYDLRVPGYRSMFLTVPSLDGPDNNKYLPGTIHGHNDCDSDEDEDVIHKPSIFKSLEFSSKTGNLKRYSSNCDISQIGSAYDNIPADHSKECNAESLDKLNANITTSNFWKIKKNSAFSKITGKERKCLIQLATQKRFHKTIGNYFNKFFRVNDIRRDNNKPGKINNADRVLGNIGIYSCTQSFPKAFSTVQNKSQKEEMEFYGPSHQSNIAVYNGQLNGKVTTSKSSKRSVDSTDSHNQTDESDASDSSDTIARRDSLPRLYKPFVNCSSDGQSIDSNEEEEAIATDPGSTDCSLPSGILDGPSPPSSPYKKINSFLTSSLKLDKEAKEGKRKSNRLCKGN